MTRLSTLIVLGSLSLALVDTSAAARDGFSPGGRPSFKASAGPGGGFHRPSFRLGRGLSRPFYPSWFKVARNPFPGFHRSFKGARDPFGGFHRPFKVGRHPFGGFHRPFGFHRLPYWPVLDSGSPIVTVVVNQTNVASPAALPGVPSVSALPVSAGLRETRPAPATVIVLNERGRGSSDMGAPRLSRGSRIVKAVPEEADEADRAEPASLGARIVHVSVPVAR
jgi:hypothetical protein